MTDIERRYTPVVVEARSRDGRMVVGGYASVFHRLSENLGGFVERVAPSFFNKSRGDGWPEVMARYNHDDNMLLGTTGGGTLHLDVDETGLSYEVNVPAARADIYELIERGDVRKSSFAFRLHGDDADEWGLSDQGFPMRTLLSGQLVDVAPVNLPAYPDSSVGLRSLARHVGAEVVEVRALAEANDLRKFFVRTDGGPKKAVYGTAALTQLKAKALDG